MLPFNWLLLSVCGALVSAIVYTFRRLPILQLSFRELLLIHFREVLGTTFWLSSSRYQFQRWYIIQGLLFQLVAHPTKPCR